MSALITLERTIAVFSFLFVIIFLFYYTMISYQNGAFAEITYVPYPKGFDNMTQVCDYYNGTLHYYEDVDREYCIVR